ncbi:MAG: hypothetical protein BV458_14010 [Thermoplasmata archaeon M9B2D]|nr:MAG: hypothetical protein BV458_14010 [Thermoplasmata archaeon M9B2D]
MKLSKENFLLAAKFVRKHARDLDQLLFSYKFENASKNDVLQALAKYQNSDGGFGHGIEPDFRLQASSPMATSIGLQYCEELDIDTEHTIISSAVKYLVSTYQSDGGYWPVTFLNVDEEPHAPWWHVKEIITPSEAKWPNPNAEIVGYLNKYAMHVPEELLKAINIRALANLESSRHIEGLVYDIICWNRIIPYLPKLLKLKARDKLKQTFQKVLPTMQETLREVRIFSLASNPDSLLYHLFPDEVNTLIDSEIERQSPDGGWWPTWKWNQYEEVWKLAEVEWAGKITTECLIALNSYNLIETS